ncbi:hypothetical protein SNOG_12291 [Parastagonospora nodorum SN15]|uniref:Uncharacterized protein n=1 Tax=Phaeosphaeria nodorum (strain SN15 / ATCC MYA-4574 / FGSC 10173) TaxID=321614 RepID=Q0U7H3_PHANO|nr:hypothetical protein SNOG_12291 [Parastagonospora nodorum SN15]EAT80104.1 hypothetical protein SNOG_12291 [Parastagonospora nodorum SN15]
MSRPVLVHGRAANTVLDGVFSCSPEHSLRRRSYAKAQATTRQDVDELASEMRERKVYASSGQNGPNPKKENLKPSTSGVNRTTKDVLIIFHGTSLAKAQIPHSSLFFTFDTLHLQRPAFIALPIFGITTMATSQGLASFSLVQSRALSAVIA